MITHSDPFDRRVERPRRAPGVQDDDRGVGERHRDGHRDRGDDEAARLSVAPVTVASSPPVIVTAPGPGARRRAARQRRGRYPQPVEAAHDLDVDRPGSGNSSVAARRSSTHPRMSGRESSPCLAMGAPAAIPAAVTPPAAGHHDSVQPARHRHPPRGHGDRRRAGATAGPRAWAPRSPRRGTCSGPSSRSAPRRRRSRSGVRGGRADGATCSHSPPAARSRRGGRRTADGHSRATRSRPRRRVRRRAKVQGGGLPKTSSFMRSGRSGGEVHGICGAAVEQQHLAGGPPDRRVPALHRGLEGHRDAAVDLGRPSWRRSASEGLALLAVPIGRGERVARAAIALCLQRLAQPTRHLGDALEVLLERERHGERERPVVGALDLRRTRIAREEPRPVGPGADRGHERIPPTDEERAAGRRSQADHVHVRAGRARGSRSDPSRRRRRLVGRGPPVWVLGGGDGTSRCRPAGTGQPRRVPRGSNGPRTHARTLPAGFRRTLASARLGPTREPHQLPELRIELGPAAQAVERAGRRAADLLEQQEGPGSPCDRARVVDLRDRRAPRRGPAGSPATSPDRTRRTGRSPSSRPRTSTTSANRAPDGGRARRGAAVNLAAFVTGSREGWARTRSVVLGGDDRRRDRDRAPCSASWTSTGSTSRGPLGPVADPGERRAHDRPCGGGPRAALRGPGGHEGVSVTFRILVREGPRSGSVSTTGPLPSSRRRGGRTPRSGRTPCRSRSCRTGGVSKWRAMATGKLFATGRRPWAALDFDRYFLPP